MLKARDFVLAAALVAIAASAAFAAPSESASQATAPTELQIVAREAVEDRSAKPRRPVFRPAKPVERDRCFEALQAELHRHRAAAEGAQTAGR